MGQCVTIEVASPGNKNASHSAIKQQHDSHKVVSKDQRKLRRDESSDEETSDDGADLEREAADQFAADENFGQEQSPINLITEKGVPNCFRNYSDKEIEELPLKFNYPDEVRGCTIENLGKTVQINIPSHSKCSLTREGKTYNLVQFHFHTPAEHMIDSKQYEMEMHLVHATDEGELAVLGFIFTTKIPYYKRNHKLTNAREFLVKKSQEIIANYGKPLSEDPVNQQIVEDEEEEEEQAEEDPIVPAYENEDERRRSSVRKAEGNDFLDQFFDQLPLKKTECATLLSRPISFDYLFEAASKTFKKSVETNEITVDMELFEYAGGLTTPPYSEGVSWMVSRQLQFINAKQLNKLSSCWGHRNTARACQHYHGRVVSLRKQAAMQGYFFN